MAILGITGGIATGKSTFARELVSRANVKLFDADRTARELLEREDVIEEVGKTFGETVISEKNIIDRGRLREIVFAGESGRVNRQKLEKILHPRIRAAWLYEVRKAREHGDWYAVDIPLLFETGAEQFFDSIIVVACSIATQWQRLLVERELPETIAGQILSAQMPLETKVAKADHVIWSDAPLVRLRDQLSLLIRCLEIPEARV